MTFANGLEWMTSETTDARIPDPAWRMEIKGIIGFTFLVKSRGLKNPNRAGSAACLRESNAS